MREIDIEKWNRKVHYECFSSYDKPTFSIAVRLDVTKLVEYTKSTGTHYFSNFLYVVSKCLNNIPEFRLRIVDGTVVEFDSIAPNYIVMNNEGVIVTCRSEMCNSYREFYHNNRADIEQAKKPVRKENFNASDTNDAFYISCLPWVDLVAMSNPYNYADAYNTSIPRLTWGKYVPECGRYRMTMDISVHHGLMDGYTVALAFNCIQQALDNIEDFFAD